MRKTTFKKQGVQNMSIPMKTIPGYYNERPGIQVGTKMEGEITLGKDGRYNFDEQGVRFLKQMGVDWVMVSDVPEHNAKTYKAVREQLEERGLKIYRLQNYQLHNMSAVTLGLPDRDRMIDRYLQYISDLGEAGIHYATYAHMGNGIWRGNIRREVRGGATAGGLDLEAPNKSIAFGDFEWPLSHGRVFGEDEIWENYEYFIKKVKPVAESAGVYIRAYHSDDPPVYTMAGVPRCIFGNEGYKRALEIADSPNIGVACALARLEGGDLMGCTDVIEALDEVNFDGCIMNDHLIDMVGGHYTCEAFFTSYLKGLVDAVQNHHKF